MCGTVVIPGILPRNDVFLPELKVGIEYNGIFWHSVENKGKNYHLNKYKFFKDLGIKVIQIFGNEWGSKRNICESLIVTTIGKGRIIKSTDCTIMELDAVTANLFCCENHLKGYPSYYPAKNIGLFYKGELLEVAVISKPRSGKVHANIEILRYSKKINTTITGGLEKILVYIKEYLGYKTIMITSNNMFCESDLWNYSPITFI